MNDEFEINHINETDLDLSHMDELLYQEMVKEHFEKYGLKVHSEKR